MLQKKLAELNNQNDVLVASVEFNNREHPELLHLITVKKHQADKIVSQTEKGIVFLEGYLSKLNPVLKKYNIAQFELARFNPDGPDFHSP